MATQSTQASPSNNVAASGTSSAAAQSVPPAGSAVQTEPQSNQPTQAATQRSIDSYDLQMLFLLAMVITAFIAACLGLRIMLQFVVGLMLLLLAWHTKKGAFNHHRVTPDQPAAEVSSATPSAAGGPTSACCVGTQTHPR